MSEWKEYKVNDICSKIVSGGTPLTTKREYYEGGSIPWLKTTEIHKGIIWNTDTFITEEGLSNSSAKLIPENSIIVAMYGDGNTAGNVAITKIPVSTNQACCNLIIDHEKVNYNFLYYYLKVCKPLLVNLKTGGSQQNLNANTIKKFPVKLPPIYEQIRISSVLVNYDELIENNNHRINVLDQIAEQIYKEWFVRMRFPNHENSLFKKGFPQEWPITYFRDFIKLNRGFDLPNDSIIEGKYPVVASTSIKAFHNQYRIEAPCITTGRSGSLGTVQYVNKQAWPLNTSLYVKDFKGNSPIYVYYFLKSMKLENFNSGAGVPTLNQNHLHTLKFALPTKVIQEKFEEIINPIFQEIDLLKEKNQNLRQTRDLLLPRLMSGKLQVSKK
jgi:type I restriction enzyme S subunit